MCLVSEPVEEPCVVQAQLEERAGKENNHSDPYRRHITVREIHLERNPEGGDTGGEERRERREKRERRETRGERREDGRDKRRVRREKRRVRRGK